MTRNVAVFGSSAVDPRDPLYAEAERLGSLLASAGLVVVNGGYGGVMEAVSAGARSRGGRVIGITAPAVFPHRAGPNPYLSEEEQAASITERIHRLIQVADATITLPGSIGTLTEFVLAWNSNFLAPLSGAAPRPQVAVGDPWPRLVALLAKEFGADPKLVRCVGTVDEAAAIVTAYLESAGPAPTAG